LLLYDYKFCEATQVFEYPDTNEGIKEAYVANGILFLLGYSKTTTDGETETKEFLFKWKLKQALGNGF
jgi:hypothetical protein